MATPPSNRFGPLWLAPGVTRFNVMANFYASFVTVGMPTGMGFLSDRNGRRPVLIIGVVQIFLLLAAILFRVIAPGKNPRELQAAEA